jgi:hypothetical protein
MSTHTHEPVSGVKIDGYRYDGGVPSRYKQRDDTYIGVMPEGNSPFAVLFVMDPETKELLRVGELGRPDLMEISPANLPKPGGHLPFCRRFSHDTSSFPDLLCRLISKSLARARKKRPVVVLLKPVQHHLFGDVRG